jgi:hypothetical protein
MTLFTMRRHAWQPLDPSRAQGIGDARLQLHHAAQLVAAIGISYLPKADDDSHTNMEWIAGALASNAVGPRAFRVAVRPHPFALVILAGDAELASLTLHGRTVADATQWVRDRIASLGVDPDRLTLEKHYEIPPHDVSRGAPFDAADDTAFVELQHWFDDADALLRRLAYERDGSPVRCWPHHFDIATLFTPAPGRSIGAGLEPGDGSYAEPYWYVNLYPPPPDPTRLTAVALQGGGAWHTDEWLGAVLNGSSMTRDNQEQQALAFLTSAIEACQANG